MVDELLQEPEDLKALRKPKRPRDRDLKHLPKSLLDPFELSQQPSKHVPPLGRPQDRMLARIAHSVATLIAPHAPLPAALGTALLDLLGIFEL